jgi:hypothetical protein
MYYKAMYMCICAMLRTQHEMQLAHGNGLRNAWQCHSAQ